MARFNSMIWEVNLDTGNATNVFTIVNRTETVANTKYIIYGTDS